MQIYLFTLLIIFIYSIIILYLPIKLCDENINKNIEKKFIVILIASSCFIFYLMIGNLFLIKNIYNEKQILLNKKSEKIRPLLIRLKKQQLDMRIYLSEYPNDHIIWSNLGQSYFMVQNFKQSKFAFIQALKLKPYNNIYLMNLITSNANLNNGKLKKKDKYLLYKFIINNINYTHALNLIALNLYQQNLFHKSLIFWKQILINLNKNNLLRFNDIKKNSSINSNIKNIIFNIKKRNKLEKILKKQF